MSETALVAACAAGLPGPSAAAAERPRRRRFKRAAAAHADASLYQDMPGVPFGGMAEPLAAAQQQLGEVAPSSEATNGFHAEDPEAVRRSLLARLAPQEPQQLLPPADCDAGHVDMDIDEEDPVKEQFLVLHGGASDGGPALIALPAKGTPDETAKAGGKPSLPAGACEGSAPADMQLDTPLKLDEDVPASAARDRPDSATLA